MSAATMNAPYKASEAQDERFAVLADDAHRRIHDFDWDRIGEHVTEQGFAVLPALLEPSACRSIASLYDESGWFRSHVHMARHNYGEGEYKYFAAPLPHWLATLRAGLYERLAPIANLWAQRLRTGVEYPPTHDAYLQQCRAAGQNRPTPLILRYVEGDYNCLHQDLYGELWFPLQVVVLLDAPCEDFAGGELLLVEQRPRAQSRGSVIPLGQGDAAVIAVNHRPRRSARGYARVTMRHGVSTVTRGRRHTLGVIFHDAR